MQFEWDEHNTKHIARHKVTPEEAEHAVGTGRYIGSAPIKGEQVFAVVGFTKQGRLLTVQYVMRGNKARVATCWNASKAEQKKFFGR